MDGPMTLSDETRQRMIDAEAARIAAEAKARAERQAAREQAERDEIERRLRASFVGTDAEWQAEKDELIRAARHDLAAERDRQEREANARRYV